MLDKVSPNRLSSVYLVDQIILCVSCGSVTNRSDGRHIVEMVHMVVCSDSLERFELRIKVSK